MTSHGGEVRSIGAAITLLVVDEVLHWVVWKSVSDDALSSFENISRHLWLSAEHEGVGHIVLVTAVDNSVAGVVSVDDSVVDNVEVLGAEELDGALALIGTISWALSDSVNANSWGIKGDLVGVVDIESTSLGIEARVVGRDTDPAVILVWLSSGVSSLVPGSHVGGSIKALEWLDSVTDDWSLGSEPWLIWDLWDLLWVCALLKILSVVIEVIHVVVWKLLSDDLLGSLKEILVKDWGSAQNVGESDSWESSTAVDDSEVVVVCEDDFVASETESLSWREGNSALALTSSVSWALCLGTKTGSWGIEVILSGVVDEEHASLLIKVVVLGAIADL